jgi:GNAT superfamily N-acetyltransferase
MKIRPATVSDYNQLCELFDEVDALHRETRPDIFRKPDGAPRSSEWVSSLISHGPRRVVEIVTIVVRKSARRRGIGKSLIGASLVWARERGADHVEISVHAFNQDAMRAYAAAGFEMSVHRLLLRSPFGDG